MSGTYLTPPVYSTQPLAQHPSATAPQTEPSAMPMQGQNDAAARVALATAVRAQKGSTPTRSTADWRPLIPMRVKGLDNQLMRVYSVHNKRIYYELYPTVYDVFRLPHGFMRTNCLARLMETIPPPERLELPFPEENQSSGRRPHPCILVTATGLRDFIEKAPDVFSSDFKEPRPEEDGPAMDEYRKKEMICAGRMEYARAVITKLVEREKDHNIEEMIENAAKEQCALEHMGITFQRALEIGKFTPDVMMAKRNSRASKGPQKRRGPGRKRKSHKSDDEDDEEPPLPSSPSEAEDEEMAIEYKKPKRSHITEELKEAMNSALEACRNDLFDLATEYTKFAKELDAVKRAYPIFAPTLAQYEKNLQRAQLEAQRQAELLKKLEEEDEMDIHNQSDEDEDFSPVAEPEEDLVPERFVIKPKFRKTILDGIEQAPEIPIDDHPHILSATPIRDDR